jgi:hypothetical protein
MVNVKKIALKIAFRVQVITHADAASQVSDSQKKIYAYDA